MMVEILKYFQLAVAVLMILSILMQSRTAGFNAANMASTATVPTKKRGAEKVLFVSTIVLAIVFVGISILFIFVG